MSRSIFGDLLQKKSDPHEAEARAALQAFRKSFDELFRLRALNEMAMRGQDKTCQYSAEEMRQRVAMFRDPEMESRFKRKMWELQKTIYRRDPTPLEIQAGPPSGDGLGLVPALFGIAAIVGGTAWGLSSITNYLSDLERHARGDEPTPQSSWGSRLESVVKGAIAVLAVGGSSYGAYRLWKWQKGKKAKALPSSASESAPSAPALPVVEEEEEEIEEEET